MGRQDEESSLFQHNVPPHLLGPGHMHESTLVARDDDLSATSAGELASTPRAGDATAAR